MAERSVLILQNIPREEPGTIKQVADNNGIKSTIVDLSQGLEIPPLDNFGAVIIMGGPDSANDQTPKIKKGHAVVRECLTRGKPYLGVCRGMQDLVHVSGGSVVKNPNRLREVGFRHRDSRQYELTLTDLGRKDALFVGINDHFRVFHLHGETVVLTDKTLLLAKGNIVRNQIVKVWPNAYGIQGHLELTDEMLGRWLEEDPWLNPVAQEVEKQFRQVKEEYTQTAWQLFTNFFRIANLV